MPGVHRVISTSKTGHNVSLRIVSEKYLQVICLKSSIDSIDGSARENYSTSVLGRYLKLLLIRF